MTPSPAQVSAVVAAYNEGPRLPAVLDVLTSYPGFKEVIVVDDGSTDDTAQVLKRYPTVTYLKQPHNRGKAQAIDRGITAAQTELVFLCDADLVGLTHPMLTALIEPVLKREVDMSVAIRGRSLPALTRFLNNLAPRLTAISGERSLTKKLWQQLPSYYKHGYRLEIGLNFLASQGRGIRYVLCPSLRQTIKEQKYGVIAGLRHRRILIGDVIKAMMAATIFRQSSPH